MHHGSKYERGSGPSEQIQHVVQINFFPDAQLILRLCHVVKQKFQYQRAAQSPPLDLEVGKAAGQINFADIPGPDEAGVFRLLSTIS